MMRLLTSTDGRRVFALLALVALTLKMIVPAGFMPGTSLAAPVVLCSGQGPMPGMAMARGGADHSGQAPHDTGQHSCAFAGLGAVSLAQPFAAPMVAPVALTTAVVTLVLRSAWPGRGLAAPPPPSHAPPGLRT